MNAEIYKFYPNSALQPLRTNARRREKAEVTTERKSETGKRGRNLTRNKTDARALKTKTTVRNGRGRTTEAVHMNQKSVHEGVSVPGRVPSGEDEMKGQKKRSSERRRDRDEEWTDKMRGRRTEGETGNK